MGLKRFGQSGLLPDFVIFDGDSQTADPDGYPSMVLPYFTAAPTIVNVAVGGQDMTAINADAAAQVDAMYSAGYRRPVVVMMGGINNMYTDGSPSGTTWVYGQIRTYCLARRATGFKVVCATLTPATKDSGQYVVYAGYETERQSLNRQLRAGWQSFADALVDIGGDPRTGTPAATYTAYYNADRLHLSTAGKAVMAELVARSLLRLG